MKPAALVTCLLLMLISATHVARLVFGIEVTAGGEVIPMWVSVCAVIGPAALAIWLWREQAA